MPRFLQRRRRRWYAVLEVPKGLVDHFGKRRLVQSLATESLTEAERLVLPVVARWKAEFEAARTGTSVPLETLARDWAEDYRKASEDQELRSIYDDVIEDKVSKLQRTAPVSADNFRRLATGDTVELAVHLEEWLSTLDNTAKTIDMKRSDVTRFVERFPYSHLVSKRSVERWAHDLQVNEGIKPATAQRYVSACRGFWTYLNRSGRLEREDDCFSDVVDKRRTKTRSAWGDVRQNFSADEVVTLWKAAQEKGDHQLSDLIWLAMWTGCRIEELCSLRVADVTKQHLTVCDAKSKAGHRSVPLHSKLTPMLRHLCANSKDGFVLDDLPPNKYGDRSNAIGKRFGRIKSAEGFDKRFVFHSIRKTVATMLENAGVPENVTADILGHEKRTMTYGLYSGGASMAVMKAAIEKLDYPVMSFKRQR